MTQFGYGGPSLSGESKCFLFVSNAILFTEMEKVINKEINISQMLQNLQISQLVDYVLQPIVKDAIKKYQFTYSDPYVLDDEVVFQTLYFSLGFPKQHALRSNLSKAILSS